MSIPNSLTLWSGCWSLSSMQSDWWKALLFKNKKQTKKYNNQLLPPTWLKCLLLEPQTSPKPLFRTAFFCVLGTRDPEKNGWPPLSGSLSNEYADGSSRVWPCNESVVTIHLGLRVLRGGWHRNSAMRRQVGKAVGLDAGGAVVGPVPRSPWLDWCSPTLSYWEHSLSGSLLYSSRVSCLLLKGAENAQEWHFQPEESGWAQRSEWTTS